MLILFRTVTTLAALALGAWSAGPQGPATVERTFEGEAHGRPPSGFSFVETRQASAGQWSLQADEDNTFLAQVGYPETGEGFVMAVLDGPQYADVRVSVRLRLAGGERSGGVVWRYQDERNYYLARVSLSEREVALYRVVHGNRIRLEREDELALDVNAWHTLRVVHEGETIRVYLGGIRVFRDRDRTFREPGAVGLWCTGSSIVHFDNLRVEEEEDEEERER